VSGVLGLQVLHWHIVDFQSFPFESKSMPKLVQGAYSPTEIYSTDDVSKIVAYAKSRGVRVMIEIDTPGHSASWAAGYPDSVASCPLQAPGTAALDPSRCEYHIVPSQIHILI
jgi:hexosaminidase